MAVCLATTASAEVLDVKVSGDITARGFFRSDYDLDDAADDNQQFMTLTTRVRVDADLTDNVAATVRLLNERDWGSAIENSEMKLDLAYITLKEMLYEPLTLKIGRQELAFGNKLIIGDSDGNGGLYSSIAAADYSAWKAFDAIRATLDYDPLVVDIVYAKAEEGEVEYQDDLDLYGINLNYTFADYDADADLYFFARHDSPLAQPDDCYVIGVRGALCPVENLDIEAELAYQFGEVGTAGSGSQTERDALAVQLSGAYLFDTTYEPKLGIGYTLLTGDDSSSSDLEAWDPMFEDQVLGEIANAGVAGYDANTNINALSLSLGLSPSETVGVKLDYYHFWLDEKGSLSDDEFGDEVDLLITYDYTEDVQFSLLGAMFMPGKGLKDMGMEEDAYEVVGTVSVSF